ncbi:hypothetical protein DIURU_005607 [Diutina rugosa]|uniref:Uncharacterized protein n=1 Tax=Diutina rugosa TaxID=5481 RepID=A0A642UC68_DIURU|nr:uncharacterized protein DIURU_005607 [Diutina rugosa]KAA8896595.1 hypothetical protein DIURU_005607 [Diutina rugosa]
MTSSPDQALFNMSLELPQDASHKRRRLNSTEPTGICMRNSRAQHAPPPPTSAFKRIPLADLLCKPPTPPPEIVKRIEVANILCKFSSPPLASPVPASPEQLPYPSPPLGGFKGKKEPADHYNKSLPQLCDVAAFLGPPKVAPPLIADITKTAKQSRPKANSVVYSSDSELSDIEDLVDESFTHLPVISRRIRRQYQPWTYN